jgi:hypothetical protein
MKIKVEWPDGSSHTYDTNHAGVQRLADFFSQMYVMGELELVKKAPPRVYDENGDVLFEEGTVEYALEYMLQCIYENGVVGPKTCRAAELALYGPDLEETEDAD